MNNFLIQNTKFISHIDLMNLTNHNVLLKKWMIFEVVCIERELKF